MVIGLLTLEFHLPGCRSLKEKRQRLSGLKQRFGRVANIAVSEAGWHDRHQQAQWCFLGLAGDRKGLEQLLAPIETYAASQVDAVITQRTLERL